VAATVGAVDPDGCPLVVRAAEGSSPEVLRALVEAGGDATLADRTGRTPLHAAAGSRMSCVQYLLSLPSVVATLGEADAAGAAAALLTAADSGDVEAVRLLADAGADVNAADRWGNTPLLAASRRGHVACALYLLTLPHVGLDTAPADALGARYGREVARAIVVEVSRGGLPVRP
jgi:ankyrin repeat protein